MATVPYTPFNTVSPNAAPEARENVEASPSEFGGLVGGAEEKLGQTEEQTGSVIGQAALQQQELVNQANVRQAMNGFMPAMADAWAKFGVLKGQAAVDARPQFDQNILALRDQFSKNLSPMAQEQYFSASSYLTNRMTLQSSEYASQQQKEYVKAEAGSYIENLIQNGVWDSGNDSHIMTNANGIAHTAESLAAQDNLGPEDTKRSVTAQTSRFYEMAIKKVAADGDPTRAFNLYNTVKSSLSGETDTNLAAFFKLTNEEMAVSGAIGRAQKSPISAGANTGPIANMNLPPEAQAFLPALSGGEGNYGSPHPGGDRSGTPIDNNRYQFLYNTWKGAAPAAGIDVNDRSPASQDAVAWSHAQQVYQANTGRSLQADLREGGHEKQIADALNTTWTSLPGGKESHTDLDTFRQRLALHQGVDSSAPMSTSTAMDELQRRGLAQPGQPPISHLAEADDQLALTPQEQNLYQHHLDNLAGSGKVVQPNGDISTVMQATVDHDGKTYSIPLVWDGKVLSPEDATQRAAAEGWNKWPAYATAAAAQDRYNQIHPFMEKDTADYLGASGQTAQASQTTAGLQAAGAPQHNPGAYGAEYQQVQNAWAEARKTFPDRPDLQRRVVAGVYEQIQQANVLQAKFEAEQAKQQRDIVTSAEGEYIPRIITDPTSVDIAKMANDPRLKSNPAEAWRLREMLKSSLNDEPKASAISHQTAISLLSDMRLSEGDPARITDLGPLYDAYASGKLNNNDFNFVQTQFREMQTADGQRLDQSTKAFLESHKASIDKSNPLMGLLDMTGGDNYYRLQTDLAAKIADYRKAGKDPFDLLNPKKSDYFGGPETMSQYQKSIPESLEDYKKRLAPEPAAQSRGPAAALPAAPRPTLESIFGPRVAPGEQAFPSLGP